MSKAYTNGDYVIVYNKWKGIFKGYHSTTQAVVSYVKGKNTLIGFVSLSKLKKSK